MKAWLSHADVASWPRLPSQTAMPGRAAGVQYMPGGTPRCPATDPGASDSLTQQPNADGAPISGAARRHDAADRKSFDPAGRHSPNRHDDLALRSINQRCHFAPCLGIPSAADPGASDFPAQRPGTVSATTHGATRRPSAANRKNFDLAGRHSPDRHDGRALRGINQRCHSAPFLGVPPPAAARNPTAQASPHDPKPDV